jgi:sulfite exporter TauE/SafE/copper chaperone CopZ
MTSRIKTAQLHIGGMTCASCQDKIERKLQHTAGVHRVQVSYSRGTADITYDLDIVTLKDIANVIEKLEYQVLSENQCKPTAGRVTGILILIVSLFVLLQQFDVLNLLVPSQLADTKMGYGMLFVIGLITSIHCIAMCGGINLSQCIPHRGEPAKAKSRFGTFAPALLYNLGRVTSYTGIGFILGLVGFLLGGGDLNAGLPAMAQGVLKLIAGVFMVIVGINMLGIFPELRTLQLRIPKILSRKISHENRSPLIVGVLNGLMPCGPLQSMQIVALASGNPFVGALSMLLFSLGTVPLMLGLGSIVSALGRKFAQKVMSVGAVLVVVLGLAMLSQGGSLSGFLPPNRLLYVIFAFCVVGIVSSISFRNRFHKAVSTLAALCVMAVVLMAWNAWALGGSPADGTDMNVVDGKQVVSSTLYSGRYPNITVQAGIPVTWIIHAPQGSINGCNNSLTIPEYGITNYVLNMGENVIEFTPNKTGQFPYSCWMGMIRGSITVIEADAAPT